MQFIIKLVPRGIKKKKDKYSIVVMNKKLGITSAYFAKIGYIEKTVVGSMLISVNKKILFRWLLKGARMNKKLGNYLLEH